MAASFVLIPGAGGMASYWSQVLPLLRAANHDAVALDLPADDERAGLADYAAIVTRAIGERRDVIVVAQSLGGFTAPLVSAGVRALVFVNAMIPEPGETAGDWWGNTGAVEARAAAARAAGYSADFDVETYFLHDVPPAALADAGQPRRQSTAMFAEPCRFARWPSIPIRVVASADDRFFPFDFQRRVARKRLRREPETLAGGHLVALSNPRGLADLLLRLERETRPAQPTVPSGLASQTSTQ